MKKIYLIHENKEWLQPLEKVLLDKGIPIKGLFDVDPKKIGKRYFGLDVKDFSELAEMKRRPYLLIFVKNYGVRAEIESELFDLGHMIGKDFIFIG